MSKKADREHPAITELAVTPDLMIRNASHYLKEHQRKTAISCIEKAIKSMRLIEVDADSLSDIAIEKAIRDLEEVENELQHHELNRPHITHAFFNALNSLAAAQIRISEHYQQSGKNGIAHVSLEYATDHLHNAIQYARSNQRKLEVELYNRLDSLIESPEATNEEIIAELDNILLQVDRLAGNTELHHNE